MVHDNKRLFFLFPSMSVVPQTRVDWQMAGLLTSSWGARSSRRFQKHGLSWPLLLTSVTLSASLLKRTHSIG